MNTLTEFDCNLFKLKSFANKLAINSKIGDVYLLTGELGVGKTTFARYFINSIYIKNNVSKPDNIKSPSYPVLINYPLSNFEIYHYDLYRLKKADDLSELAFFENLERNISIIEWPEIIINNFNLNKYYLINIKIINENVRKVRFEIIN